MRQGQVNFAKGEVSPEIAARFDVQAYSSAVRRASNVQVMKYGGLRKRMGTRYVAEVLKPDSPVRLIPFQFSLEQSYVLEIGQGYMRPAALGGMVLEEHLAITGIATGATTTIEAAHHAYSVGDQVFISHGGPNGELVQLLSTRFFIVTAVPDANHFTIDVDTTGLSFMGWTGGITRPVPPVPDPVDPPPPDPVVPDPVEPPPPPPLGGGGGGLRELKGDGDIPQLVSF